MNERLNEINGELKKLNEALARQSKLEAQLKDLQEQRAEREQRVMDTSRMFWEEQEDVDKLEKGGLRSLLLSITGDKEARLSQERREALAAKLQYDQAQRDLEDIDGRIRAVLGEKDSLRIDRIRRDALLEEKGELLKQMGGEAGARLTELDQRLDELESQRREVGEAISAGRTAEAALSSVLNSLDSAEDWGTWDMFGGGLLSTMAKHEHLDDAQAGIGYAQNCLSRFRTELADVQHMEIPQVHIGEFATFADYFFDGLFADWYVQSRINDAQRGVEAVDSRVCEALNRLQWMDQNLAGEQRGLRVFDYYAREELQVANAVPTAEGAIQRAMEATDGTLHGSRCLVLGFGRVGKLLAYRLRNLGAQVTVAARKYRDLAWIDAMDFCSLPIGELSGHLGEFDLIFNTVPALLLDAPRLTETKENCLLMELASAPGGIEEGAAPGPETDPGAGVAGDRSAPGRCQSYSREHPAHIGGTR